MGYFIKINENKGGKTMINGKKKVEKIMRQFDFRKVMDVIQKSKIYWKDGEGDEYKPSQQEVENLAYELLKAAVVAPQSFVKLQNNGFIVFKKQTSIEISYVIEYQYV